MDQNFMVILMAVTVFVLAQQFFYNDSLNIGLLKKATIGA